ncbi:unnamed protein product [Spirodela intermedia]|uniref:Uncharacterized protein n=1 Tax=Spirodela intermedia TaxID=51605 RepID=A0A7I8KHC3_SPIIN|nr:unnamed protein product [Spirodela intermedia]
MISCWGTKEDRTMLEHGNKPKYELAFLMLHASSPSCQDLASTISRSFRLMRSADMPSHSKRCLPRASTGISCKEATLEDGHSTAIV